MRGKPVAVSCSSSHNPYLFCLVTKYLMPRVIAGLFILPAAIRPSNTP